MKKAVSFVLLSLLVCSPCIPTFAQKGRFVRMGTLPTIPQTQNEASFSSVHGFTDGAGVWLEWEMNVERNNIGFFVYRITKTGAERVAPERLIQGSGPNRGDRPSYGSKYNLFDRNGSFRSVYYVESLLADGSSTRTPTFSVQYVNDLTPYAGMTSRELIFNAESRDSGSGKTSLSLPKDLRREAESYAIEANSATHLTVISRPGVRIGVKNEGLYRISRAQLIAGGFDVSSDPNLWQIYVEGVEQAMNVPADASYIEFYGKGTDTQETAVRTYYLIKGDTPGKRFGTRVVRPAASTVISPSFSQVTEKRERTDYVNSILNGDDENFVGRFVGTTAATYKFNLVGVDFGSPETSIQVKFQGFSQTPHNVEVTLNGKALPPAVGDSLEQYKVEVKVPTSYLVEGSNSLVMRSTSTPDRNFFVSISLGFAKKFVPEQNQISFFTQNFRGARLDGFSSANVRVLDITDTSSPIRLSNLTAQPSGSTFSVIVPASTRGRVYFGVEDSALLSADSITPNNPELLGQPTNGANLVIIAHKDFLTQAEAWAAYRRNQGITVKVVDATEIYDEFNYGTLSGGSIKSFLGYAVNNWQTPPQYVLLLGDAYFDGRNYLGFGAFNYVPTLTVDTIFRESASDEALGDFNGDGLSEIAIGRIAARDTQTIATVLGKVATWEGLPAPMSGRGGLFVSDLPIGYDFQAMSDRLRAELPPTMTVRNLNRGDADSAASLINEINTGKYVVNYTGHGAAGLWAASNFFTTAQVPLLTNSTRPSLFVSLSCLNGFFDNVTDSLAETLTKSQTGGAVAMWASSGETTPDVQEVLGARFFNQLGAGNITRLGDLIKDSKSAVDGGRSVRLSWALIGDPMLKMR